MSSTSNPSLSGEVTNSRLSIIYRPLADLNFDRGNPRRHSPARIKLIANTINAFGFVCPVLIDVDGSVITGHGNAKRRWSSA
jgi:ParB-like chromosome segregation protein Spo0J